MKHISIALLLLLLTSAACSAVQPQIVPHIISLSDLPQIHAPMQAKIQDPRTIKDLRNACKEAGLGPDQFGILQKLIMETPEMKKPILQ